MTGEVQFAYTNRKSFNLLSEKGPTLKVNYLRPLEGKLSFKVDSFQKGLGMQENKQIVTKLSLL